MPIRVLLVDDHAVVRQGLKMFLSLDPELEIAGEAGTGEAALEEVERLEPDVVLMDLLMPGMGGIAATAEIRRSHPEVEVVALTSVLEDASVINAVKAGAIGYLLKDTRAEDLCRALKAAAAGQVQLSPEAAARLMREIREPEPRDGLSEREGEVLELVARGLSNREVAGHLGIAEKTVKSHMTSVMSKLGVSSRTQAALYAWRSGR